MADASCWSKAPVDPRLEMCHKICLNFSMGPPVRELGRGSPTTNAELEPKNQKYKRQVVLRRDIVKDDSGAYAVLTEQGSSASQMTAAKVMDVIARLPDCDGQAADAVSAYTQVKNGGCSQIAQNSKVRVSGCMDTSSTTQVVQIMVKHRRSCGSSRTKCVRSPAFFLYENGAGKHVPRAVENTVWRGAAALPPGTR